MQKMLAEATFEDSLVTGDIPEAPQVDLTPVAKKLLDFTVVHGYLRGEHAKQFELHATGCRDLRSKQAKQLYNYSILASDPDHALDQAIEDMQGVTKKTDYHVQPCCLLKRMKAIGRA